MRLAAYQCRALTGDVAANLSRLEWAARAASAGNADVLVLPELYLTGYCLGERIHDFAMSLDSPILAEVAAIARRHKVALVLGYPERRPDGTANAAALWNAEGEILARYSKINLFGPEEHRLFRPGTHLNASPFNGHKVGLLICYDVEIPATARALSGLGADLLLAPTANMLPYRAAAITAVRARALETASCVVYANYVGPEGDLVYTGLSAIVGPDGEDLARAGEHGEALLIAEVPAQQFPSFADHSIRE